MGSGGDIVYNPIKKIFFELKDGRTVEVSLGNIKEFMLTSYGNWMDNRSEIKIVFLVDKYVWEMGSIESGVPELEDGNTVSGEFVE